MADDKSRKPNKADEKMTPEEKLFKVIATGGRDYRFDDKGEGPPLPEEGDQDPFGRIESSLAKMGVFFSELFRTRKIPQGAFPLSFKSPAATQTFTRVFQIQNVNRGLTSLVALAALFFIFDFMFGRQGRGPASLEPSEAALSGITKEITSMQSEVPELSHYLKPAKTRDLFSLPKPRSEGAPSISEKNLVVEAPPVNYKLVGISWDAKEYVAMVEYEKEKAARFVRKGDSLQNGVKVKKVTETSATLVFGEREWELT